MQVAHLFIKPLDNLRHLYSPLAGHSALARKIQREGLHFGRDGVVVVAVAAAAAADEGWRLQMTLLLLLLKEKGRGG